MKVSLNPHRPFRQTDSRQGAQGELPLAIDSPACKLRSKPPRQPALDHQSVKRAIDLDEILWMRDVVHLTGKHRCTIHRWMHSGLFPQKNAPRHRPTGWLKSTIECWLLGAPSTSGRDA
jgi:predicted DNA-binding transcriptional regulator AlpA